MAVRRAGVCLDSTSGRRERFAGAPVTKRIGARAAPPRGTVGEPPDRVPDSAADERRESRRRASSMRPTALIAARIHSPPLPAATATRVNSAPMTRAIAARPIRSSQGRSGGPGRKPGPAAPGSHRRARWPRPHSGHACRSSAERLEVERHEVAGERRRPGPAASAALDDHGDRDARILDRREPDEPRVRRAGSAELGGARTCRRSGCPGPSRRS